MDIFNIFSFIGGISLFLYGMHVMGASLEKTAGGKLERILEKLTSNPIKGVAFGTVVTAVIQSSSAVTVMVVGFVNSGIMKLEQAVGIIMGANIGTTVTSWILSLTGIESGNVFMRMLKPENFAPVFALVGVILLMFVKKGKKKDVGSIFLGFAVLMFGMTMMGDAVKPLADSPKFGEVLTFFTNPFLGVLVGALFTAIIQSSSASVGILQSLTLTGKITYASAIPVIMGQNIGTCVTAIISCFGANKNAKRAAMVHLYFNLMGSILFLTLFYSANAIFDFTFLNDVMNPAHIAVVHTIFNVLSTLVLLPLCNWLCKLATLTIRDKSVGTDTTSMLDERLLTAPTFAIEQCKQVTNKMAELSKEALFDAIGIINKFDDKVARDIIEKEDMVDKYEDRIGTYLVKLSSKELKESDSKQISKLLHMIGDFERISDHAVNLVEVAREINEKSISFSEKANSELDIMLQAVNEILELTVDAFEQEDVDMARKVEPLEEVIDNLRDELKSRHIARLQEGNCTIELGFIFSDLLTNLERVSDHCSNIAISTIQMKSSSLAAHGYLIDMMSSEHPEFTEKYASYKQKYLLPQE